MVADGMIGVIFMAACQYMKESGYEWWQVALMWISGCVLLRRPAYGHSGKSGTKEEK